MTFADICIELAEKVQTLSEERIRELEPGSNAWLQLQKLDMELRLKVIPELAKRLKIACDVLREADRFTGNFARLTGKLGRLRDIAEELEAAVPPEGDHDQISSQ